MVIQNFQVGCSKVPAKPTTALLWSLVEKPERGRFWSGGFGGVEHMSRSLNSLNGVNIGNYIGQYYRAYEGGY